MVSGKIFVKGFVAYGSDSRKNRGADKNVINPLFAVEVRCRFDFFRVKFGPSVN